MNTFSSVTIVGRLTKDAEMRMTAGENASALVRFSIAVNRRKKDNVTGEYVEEANFFNVSFFGKNASSICAYLQKGILIGVVGELTQRRYQNSEGKDVSTVEIIASNVHLIESKAMREGQNQQEQTQVQTQTSKSNRYPAEMTKSPDDFTEDDIPF